MTRDIVPPEAITIPATATLSIAERDNSVRQALADAQAQRRSFAEDLRQLSPFLPELPDQQVASIYDQVVEYERHLASPNLIDAEYDFGTARFDDELFVAGTTGLALMEAQHATSPVRKATGRREAPDHGTAGLGYVLAQEGLGRIIIPRGLQTGNANVDAEHSVKMALQEEMASADYQGFLSIHGCRPGKVTDLRDKSEIHAIVGLGLEPREASFAAAEKLVDQAAASYGLRLVIGNITPHLNFAQNPEAGQSFWDLGDTPEKDKAGLLKATRVAGLMQNSTVSFMTRETSGQPDRPVMQLEITRSLRLTPRDTWVRPDPSAEKMGVYLGVCLGGLAAEVVAQPVE